MGLICTYTLSGTFLGNLSTLIGFWTLSSVCSFTSLSEEMKRDIRPVLDGVCASIYGKTTQRETMKRLSHHTRALVFFARARRPKVNSTRSFHSPILPFPKRLYPAESVLGAEQSHIRRAITGGAILCQRPLISIASIRSIASKLRFSPRQFKIISKMSSNKIWLRAETKPAEARSACKLQDKKNPCELTPRSN